MLQPGEIASRLVTNNEYAAFIAAGGYADPVYWLAEGWDWRVLQGRGHPLYWHGDANDWREFTLDGLVPLNADAPVIHISYFEFIRKYCNLFFFYYKKIIIYSTFKR